MAEDYAQIRLIRDHVHVGGKPGKQGDVVEVAEVSRPVAEQLVATKRAEWVKTQKGEGK
jgi:hypothetical protein